MPPEKDDDLSSDEGLVDDLEDAEEEGDDDSEIEQSLQVRRKRKSASKYDKGKDVVFGLCPVYLFFRSNEDQG